MHWIFLVLAIIAEVAGTTSMKLSAGFSKLTPSVLIFVFYFLSLTLLTFALKGIELSIAYAIWSGLGSVIIVAISLLVFSEQLSILKVVSILLIIIGVVGLNLGESDKKESASVKQEQKANL